MSPMRADGQNGVTKQSIAVKEEGRSACAWLACAPAASKADRRTAGLGHGARGELQVDGKGWAARERSAKVCCWAWRGDEQVRGRSLSRRIHAATAAPSHHVLDK